MNLSALTVMSWVDDECDEDVVGSTDAAEIQ